MKRRLSALIPFVSVLAAVGCSNSISDTGGVAGAGGSTAGAANPSGGSVAMGGSTNPSGGAAVGGSPTSTAGTSAGGESTGGAATGGGSAGGSTGGSTPAGGAGGAAGGAAGAAGGGTAGASSTITISGTTAGPFDNSFMITACKDSGNGYDCLNAPASGMCDSAKWSYMSATGAVSTGEANGFSTDDVFTVTGGDTSKIYDVTVHVVGQVEGRTYVNGMAHSTAIDPGKEKNDMLYVGGQPGPNRQDYNVFQMVITGGTAIAGAPTYYAFNSTLVSLEGQHHNYSIDETFTFKVKSGMTITFSNHDSNCRSIMNCGTASAAYSYSSAAACTANARSTPADVTLPATFHGVTIMSPTKFQTQFVNFKVTGIVAE
jgi:hypothetical protein